MTKEYDIVIAGAGPAGAAAALALRDSGLRVALVDRQAFPRHKTCGDAIPGPALKYLRQLASGFDEALAGLTEKQRITHSEIFAPNGRSIAIGWKTVAYNSPRFDFDAFLLALVRRHTPADIFEGTEIRTIVPGEVLQVKSRGEELILTCRLLIGCDGANSIVSRHLHTSSPEKSSYCMAVSAYFEGVDCPPHCNQFFLLKDYLPGYFWIFPLGNDRYNAGFGLLAAAGSGRRKNLRKCFSEIMAEAPGIREKFGRARMVSGIRGFPLPIGGKPRRISGRQYLLAGDAASLVDPLQGHGIDKAVFSGMLAARQAVACFRANDFSAAFLQAYDQAVGRTLGRELSRNYRLMQFLTRNIWVVGLLTYATDMRVVKEGILKMVYRRRGSCLNRDLSD